MCASSLHFSLVLLSGVHVTQMVAFLIPDIDCRWPLSRARLRSLSLRAIPSSKFQVFFFSVSREYGDDSHPNKSQSLLHVALLLQSKGESLQSLLSRPIKAPLPSCTLPRGISPLCHIAGLLTHLRVF